jgi:streptomycin 6-kinase
VLKVGIPHFEAEHEIDGLRFWDGDPTVRLLAADRGANAMLLERCEPGTTLAELPEPEQDVVIASVLRRLWRVVPDGEPFRPLAAMTEEWGAEMLALPDVRADRGLRREGIRLFMELPRTAPTHVLLATDLHAGNVLRARREPWLVIDPKPFLGDPAYDATQHLLNCTERLAADPVATVRRFAELLELDHERVRLWTFARLAVEAIHSWDDVLPAARALAG